MGCDWPAPCDQPAEYPLGLLTYCYEHHVEAEDNFATLVWAHERRLVASRNTAYESIGDFLEAMSIARAREEAGDEPFPIAAGTRPKRKRPNSGRPKRARR